MNEVSVQIKINNNNSIVIIVPIDKSCIHDRMNNPVTGGLYI